MRQPVSPHSSQGILQSFKNAFTGIGTLIVSQRNARIHVSITTIVVLAGVVCSISRLEWCLLVLVIILVWVAEAFNTGIEFLTDLVSPEHHPLAGQAKDVAAGAVLFAACGAVIVGCFILWPHILELF